MLSGENGQTINGVHTPKFESVHGNHGPGNGHLRDTPFPPPLSEQWPKTLVEQTTRQVTGEKKKA